MENTKEAREVKEVKEVKDNGKLHLVLKRSSILKFAIFQLIALVVIIGVVVTICLFTIKRDKEVVKVPVNEVQVIEKEVEIEKPVEVPVEVEVEKEVIVEVVNTEEVERLAQEKATEMYAELRSSYVAQADQELTEEKVNEMFEALKAEYVAEADATEVERLATERAMTMFEEYKTEFVAEQEAALAAAVSTIRVYIYGGKENFYLCIEGQKYERLSYDKIYAALQADARFEGYKVNRVTNKDAVEVFIGEDYTSTRTIRIELK